MRSHQDGTLVRTWWRWGVGGEFRLGCSLLPNSPCPSTYPCGLLLMPDIGVPGAPLVAVGWGEGDLLFTCKDSSGSAQF